MSPLRKKVSTSLLPVAIAALAQLPSPALHAQSVEFFAPQGEVKAVRQVTARFARAMVPFGDPREIDPFAIDCVEKGKGRWADMKNWIYDFDRDLPAGVRCSFTLKPGLTALDGSPLASGQRFEFAGDAVRDDHLGPDRRNDVDSRLCIFGCLRRRVARQRRASGEAEHAQQQESQRFHAQTSAGWTSRRSVQAMTSAAVCTSASSP